MAYVYILQSIKNGRYYIGSTKDVDKRLVKHNAREVVATKRMAPLKLALKQQYPNLGIARKIETKLKKFKRKDFINKIVKDGEIRTAGS